MVHQHFMLIPVMTVAENIVLAAEPHRRGAARPTMRPTRASRELSRRFELRDRPRRPRRGHLGRPAAAGRDPEGALPRRRHPDPRRADRGADAAGGRRALRDPPKTLQREGMSIIFISHKLHEVLEIADRITVLRRGKRDRHRSARGRDRAGPRAADGRTRGAPAGREAPWRRPASRCSTSRI